LVRVGIDHDDSVWTGPEVRARQLAALVAVGAD
jgi:hypothetical protein